MKPELLMQELEGLWCLEWDRDGRGFSIGRLRDVVERNGEQLVKGGKGSGRSLLGVFKDLGHAQEGQRVVRKMLKAECGMTNEDGEGVSV
jgi:hypothetical protein